MVRASAEGWRGIGEPTKFLEMRRSDFGMTGATEREDYSQDVRLASSGIARLWFLAVGHLSVGLAILGAVLPLVPTTPFLLLAAACYARGSSRFYYWLLNTRGFGPMIRNWREHRAVALGHKLLAIGVITVSIGSTVLFFMPHLAGKVVLSGLGLGWIAVLLRLPTR